MSKTLDEQFMALSEERRQMCQWFFDHEANDVETLFFGAALNAEELASCVADTALACGPGESSRLMRLWGRMARLAHEDYVRIGSVFDWKNKALSFKFRLAVSLASFKRTPLSFLSPSKGEQGFAWLFSISIATISGAFSGLSSAIISCSASFVLCTLLNLIIETHMPLSSKGRERLFLALLASHGYRSIESLRNDAWASVSATPPRSVSNPDFKPNGALSSLKRLADGFPPARNLSDRELWDEASALIPNSPFSIGHFRAELEARELSAGKPPNLPSLARRRL